VVPDLEVKPGAFAIGDAGFADEPEYISGSNALASCHLDATRVGIDRGVGTVLQEHNQPKGRDEAGVLDHTVCD
jgi:hypothetical protein